MNDQFTSYKSYPSRQHMINNDSNNDYGDIIYTFLEDKTYMKIRGAGYKVIDEHLSQKEILQYFQEKNAISDKVYDKALMILEIIPDRLLFVKQPANPNCINLFNCIRGETINFDVYEDRIEYGINYDGCDEGGFTDVKGVANMAIKFVNDMRKPAKHGNDIFTNDDAIRLIKHSKNIDIANKVLLYIDGAWKRGEEEIREDSVVFHIEDPGVKFSGHDENCHEIERLVNKAREFNRTEIMKRTGDGLLVIIWPKE